MLGVLTALPGAVEQVERPLYPFPVLQVEEGVGDGLAVASLQNVLWGKNQTLHLQKILRKRRKRTPGLGLGNNCWIGILFSIENGEDR